MPTPLQELPHLTKRLGGPRIFVKRDDMTGLAFGGNKTRKLEYLMADALKHKADYIVTGAGFHSNWLTQAVAASRRLGLKVAIVKTGPRDGYEPESYDGNHLLHFLMGANIKVVRPENRENALEETMEALKAEGHTPYPLTATGSTPLGVAGYMNAILEITSQAIEKGININYIVHATGSGGTQAGLVIGAKAFSTGIKVVASTTGGGPRDQQIERVSNLIDESLGFLKLDLRIDEDDVIVFDQYAGEGYGFITEGKAEAIKMVAESEGLFLDPVYTASSMACLIGLCREGYFKPDDLVVFLHTGGQAALFPYRDPLKAYVVGKEMPWTIPPWSPSAAK